MTRRRAALLAAVVAMLLGAAYLLSRRGHAAVELPDLTPRTPETPAVPPSPRETADAAAPGQTAPVEAPGAAAPEEDSPTAPLPARLVAPAGRTNEPPRSWGTGRAVPARTPAPILEPVAEPAHSSEEPLPAWVRAAIVAAALVAFFAVSLIATKQV